MNKEEIEPYRKNIEILDVNIVAKSFFGEELIIKIRDNNNILFKIKKVKRVIFGNNKLRQCNKKYIRKIYMENKKV